jgi:hypothetical protein
MIGILVLAFLWYGIYRTIQDLLIWSGVATLGHFQWSFQRWNLHAAMLDISVAAVSLLAAILLLRVLLT